MPIKAFFEDLDVLAWKKDMKTTGLGAFWQGIVGALAAVFKNQPKDRLAFKAPISGTFENPQVDVWTAAATLLRNAFITALVPKFDRSIKIESIDEPIPENFL